MGVLPRIRYTTTQRALTARGSERAVMDNVLRILDANFNRAREALRVMEDYARFVLDDASLSRRIKQARHDLRNAFPGFVRDSLVRHREIVHDVGRGITTEAERQREASSDVVIAACRRLSEALRTMEEYAKTFDRDVAAKLEQLRYAGYELERHLTITLQARDRLGGLKLYVLITESLCRHDWYATAEAALRGGADCLQLREKELPDAELVARVRRLTALCHDHDALLIVNDRADIAAAAGADGVHLGQNDLPVAGARRVLPTHAIVGKSTHTPAQIGEAVTETPDYIAVGPIFESDTKPQDHTAGVETLAQARSRTALPLVAIGGIRRENAGQVLDAVDCCLCVCSAVISAPDVEKACSQLASVVQQHCSAV